MSTGASPVPNSLVVPEPDQLDELNEQDAAGRQYHRYTRNEKLKLFDEMCELKYRDSATWDDIAAKFAIARSTIRIWRKTEEWRMTEASWRRIMREESRSDATLMASDALGVLQDLMHNARSEFVRYSAAGKIIDVVGVGDEVGEAVADTATELNKFLQKIQGRAHQRAKTQGAILEEPVLPGGILPAVVMKQNEAVMAERQAEQDAIEAEFADVTVPTPPQTSADPDSTD